MLLPMEVCSNEKVPDVPNRTGLVAWFYRPSTSRGSVWLRDRRSHVLFRAGHRDRLGISVRHPLRGHGCPCGGVGSRLGPDGASGGLPDRDYFGGLGGNALGWADDLATGEVGVLCRASAVPAEGWGRHSPVFPGAVVLLAHRVVGECGRQRDHP